MINPQTQQLIGRAIECFQNGSPQQAEEILVRILNTQSNNLPALEILGLIKATQGNHLESAKLLKKAVKLNPQNPATQYNLAKALSEGRDYVGSLIHHEKALQLAPNNPDGWLNYGQTLANLQRHEQALTAFNNALSINPHNAKVWLDMSTSLGILQRYDDAIGCCDQALAVHPNLPEAWLNKGSAYSELKQFAQAVDCYQKAVDLKPNYADAWYSKGIALEKLDHYQEALGCYDKAIEIYPNHAKAWLNRGELLVNMGLRDRAIDSFENSLRIDPNIEFLIGTIIHTKLAICLWSNYQNDVDYLLKDLALNKHVAVPLALLSITDSPQDQLRSAQIWIDTKYPPNHFLGPIPKRSAGAKIKIAYFSADFREHPVAYLMAELFELHDRSCFEVYAFSLKQDASSPMRKRLQSAFDHFIEVDNKTDVEIAALARELQIDIAIDLGGHTQNARTGIFAYRAAPIQVNYLGFAGTMGASYMDYIVVDKITIPDEQAKYYLERKVYLPNSYMVDDSNRAPSNALFKRADFGLPEDGMVFCCFNNSYKFNPTRITSFAQILSAVPGSVLWVTENNPSFRENLLAQFNRLGIADARIVFATRIDPMEDHLARYRLADLFLDTSPYNAHTTAMDSLKAGVPIISLAGKSFASRVGASLLTAVGLPELITHDEQSFVDLAIKLGENRGALQSIKEKLATNLQDTPLFDTQLFCKHLEMAYQEMYSHYLQELPPTDIYVL